MTHPLDGIRVLDLTRLLPGGVATMMLADLGADVIKIEDPAGGDYARWMPPHIDGQSVFFRMNNRSKRSMILNLKDKQGVEVFKSLVKTSDVVIEGFRPGVMARLGCDYDTLTAINPKLIYAALSGWGIDGPYADKSGHDLNYVSIAGLTGAMQTPQVMGGQVADIGGAYIVVAGILAALLRRERTGDGAFVDTSLSESALPFMLYNWVEALSLHTGEGLGGLTGGLACYRIYTSRDNQPVALAALEEKFWTNFCTAVERPDLISGYQKPQRQRYLVVELQEIFATRTAAEWHTALADADCCFSLVNMADEVGNDPHYQAREMLGRFDDGTAWMRSPVRVSSSEPPIENTIPEYGAHTREILAENGYDMVAIDALIANGIVKVS